MSRTWAMICICFVAACGSTGPVPMGPDTYMLSKAGGFFDISGGTVKADLYREAADFCLRQGKDMMPVSSTSHDSAPYTYATAEIDFRCLSPGDPDLGRPSPAADVRVKIVP